MWTASLSAVLHVTMALNEIIVITVPSSNKQHCPWFYTTFYKCPIFLPLDRADPSIAHPTLLSIFPDLSVYS